MTNIILSLQRKSGITFKSLKSVIASAQIRLSNIYLNSLMHSTIFRKYITISDYKSTFIV